MNARWKKLILEMPVNHSSYLYDMSHVLCTVPQISVQSICSQKKKQQFYSIWLLRNWVVYLLLLLFFPFGTADRKPVINLFIDYWLQARVGLLIAKTKQIIRTLESTTDLTTKVKLTANRSSNRSIKIKFLLLFFLLESNIVHRWFWIFTRKKSMEYFYFVWNERK